MNDISQNIANESPDAIANRLINKAEYRDGLQEIAIGIMILSLARSDAHAGGIQVFHL